MTPKTQAEPRLKETEYGYYIREKWRSKSKRTQKTHRFPKNLEKVILARIGNLEIYVYPYQFPDKVFLGIYPINVALDKYQIADFFRAHNTVKWFLNGDWTNKPGRSKKANAVRRRLIQAYIYGEKNRKDYEKRSVRKKKPNVARQTPLSSPKHSPRTQIRLENGALVLIK